MSDSNSDKLTEESMARLTQIAALLDCPVSNFFVSSEGKQGQYFAEVVRLWISLKTDAQREQVIEFIKNISKISTDEDIPKNM